MHTILILGLVGGWDYAAASRDPVVAPVQHPVVVATVVPKPTTSVAPPPPPPKAPADGKPAPKATPQAPPVAKTAGCGCLDKPAPTCRCVKPAVAAAPSPKPTVKSATPQRFRVTDIDGNSWTHTDPEWLEQWVIRRNLQLKQEREAQTATQYATVPGPTYYLSPMTAGACASGTCR